MLSSPARRARKGVPAAGRRHHAVSCGILAEPAYAAHHQASVLVHLTRIDSRPVLGLGSSLSFATLSWTRACMVGGMLTREGGEGSKGDLSSPRRPREPIRPTPRERTPRTPLALNSWRAFRPQDERAGLLSLKHRKSVESSAVSHRLKQLRLARDLGVSEEKLTSVAIKIPKNGIGRVSRAVHTDPDAERPQSARRRR